MASESTVYKLDFSLDLSHKEPKCTVGLKPYEQVGGGNELFCSGEDYISTLNLDETDLLDINERNEGQSGFSFYLFAKEEQFTEAINIIRNEVDYFFEETTRVLGMVDSAENKVTSEILERVIKR